MKKLKAYKIHRINQKNFVNNAALIILRSFYEDLSCTIVGDPVRFCDSH